MQKILYVIDSLETANAGTESQLVQLIDSLDRQCYEPHLLVLKVSPYLREHDFSCAYTQINYRGLYDVLSYVRLMQLAKKWSSEGYHLAHIYFNDASIICPPIFKVFGIDSIISRRDMGFWYTPLYRLLLRLNAHIISAMVANSEAVRLETMRQEHISSTKTRVIFNGFLAYEAKVEEKDDQKLIRLRERCDVIAVVVANIRPIKRIEDIIAAASLINHSEGGNTLGVIIIGAGDTLALRKKAAEHSIDENVIFTGVRNDIAQCLSYADIGMLCSESEGLSNAIIEYLYAALPVICSDTGGNPELVRHEDNGLLYPVADITQLTRCLLRLISDSALRENMGQRGQAFAKARFSIQCMLADHDALYKQLASAQTLAVNNYVGH